MSRRPEVAFHCTRCGKEAVAGLEGEGRCLSCAAPVKLDVLPALRERMLERCPVCGGSQLYVQRDFNQKAGLAIVAAGAILAPFTPFYASLFVAAAVDALLYALLPEITVCYRCQAHFRGFAPNPAHHPFDLHTAEQYGRPSTPRG